jgi:dTDP-4-dehydrorhamnose reductase
MGRMLVIGSAGMLGRAWVELLDAQGIPFDTADMPRIDLRDVRTFDGCVRRDHQVVVNCAAFTDVDGAEDQEDLARRINGDAVGALAARCAQVGARLVHYSTDYVFDGQGRAPYPVDAPRSPINAYGRSKLHGERLLEAAPGKHLLVRTSWLYAPWGKSFVRSIAAAARQRPSLRVVNDQRGRPTSAQHLAQASLALVQAGAEATFHVAGGGECTWYDLARAVVARTGAPCHVEPCTTEAFPRPAPRPAYSVLETSAAEGLVGPFTPWQDQLDAVLAVADGVPA